MLDGQLLPFIQLQIYQTSGFQLLRSISYQQLFHCIEEFDLDYMSTYSWEYMHTTLNKCSYLLEAFQKSCLKASYTDQAVLILNLYNRIVSELSPIQRGQFSKSMTNISQAQCQIQTNKQHQLSKQVQQKFRANQRELSNEKCINQRLKKNQEKNEAKPNYQKILSKFKALPNKKKLCCLQYVIENDLIFTCSKIRSNTGIQIIPGVGNIIMLTKQQVYFRNLQKANKIIIQNICGLANSKNTSGGLIFLGLEKKNQLLARNNQEYIVKGERMTAQQKKLFKKQLIERLKLQVISYNTGNCNVEVEVSIDFIPIVKCTQFTSQSDKDDEKYKNFYTNSSIYKPNYHLIRISVAPTKLNCKNTFIVKTKVSQQVKQSKKFNVAKVQQKQQQTPPAQSQKKEMKMIDHFQIFLYNHLSKKSQEIFQQNIYNLISIRYKSYNSVNFLNSDKILTRNHLHFEKVKHPLKIQFPKQVQSNSQLDHKVKSFNLYKNQKQDICLSEQQPDGEQSHQANSSSRSNNLKYQNLIVAQNCHLSILEKCLKGDKVRYNILKKYQQFKNDKKTKNLHIIQHNIKFDILSKYLAPKQNEQNFSQWGQKKIILLSATSVIFFKTDNVVDKQDWTNLSGWLKVKINEQQSLKVYHYAGRKEYNLQKGYYMEMKTTQGGIFTYFLLKDKCPLWNISFKKKSQLKNIQISEKDIKFHQVDFIQYVLTGNQLV